jgi:hypothetical protein
MNREKTAFRKVFDQLLMDEKVKDQQEFADILEFQAISVSQMLRGRKALNFRVLKNLDSGFNININFLTREGQGRIYEDECISQNLLLAKDEEIKKLKAQIEILKETLNERKS